MHPQSQNNVTNPPYKEAIGSLMYLSTGTRPDITFAVYRASRYMEKPTKLHWDAVKRILKYIKGTHNLGFIFKATGDHQLHAYSDCDYAGEIEGWRSTSGYVVTWERNMLTWNSRRQSTVALSITDAEYITACKTSRVILWLKKLIKEVCDPEQEPSFLYLGNQSAIKLIKNPVVYRRTKHIDVKFHYVREK